MRTRSIAIAKVAAKVAISSVSCSSNSGENGPDITMSRPVPESSGIGATTAEPPPIGISAACCPAPAASATTSTSSIPADVTMRPSSSISAPPSPPMIARAHVKPRSASEDSSPTNRTIASNAARETRSRACHERRSHAGGCSAIHSSGTTRLAMIPDSSSNPR
ncbi:MAG TPA: hypothetical protein VGB64_15835 [Actinomycetota bacterium]